MEIPRDIIEKIVKEYPNKTDAEKYNLCQAEMLIRMFEASTGKNKSESTLQEMEEYSVKRKVGKNFHKLPSEDNQKGRAIEG